VTTLGVGAVVLGVEESLLLVCMVGYGVEAGNAWRRAVERVSRAQDIHAKAGTSHSRVLRILRGPVLADSPWYVDCSIEKQK
jgi:hypothetical protein